MGVRVRDAVQRQEVDVENKVVRSEEGTETQYDLLISIPPHRGMEVVETDGLGQGGWIPTDRHQLKMTGHDNVYVLGDTTNLPVKQDRLGGAFRGRGGGRGTSLQ